MFKGFKVLDVHTHVYPEKIAEKAVHNLGEFYNFTVHGNGTHSGLEKEAKAAGIDGFFLFCVATNARQVEHVNTSVAALCESSKKNGFEAYGFAGMHQDFENKEAELDRCISLGLKGIKLHPDIQGANADCDSFMELYELMEKKNLKLYLHVGDDRPQYRFSDPERVANVARTFPKLNIVAAHLGGYKAWDSAKEHLYGKFDNVYYDCSSSLWAMTPERAKELIFGCGLDRVMFGTDYPVCNLDEYLDMFMKLDLTDKQREDIFYNNAKRFINL